MSQIGNIFFLTFAAAFLIALARAVAHDGEKEGVTKLALSLVLLSVLAAPLSSLVLSLPDVLAGEGSTLPDLPADDPAYLSAAEEGFRQGIQRALCEKFSLSEDEVRVRVVNFDFSAMRAEGVTVFLTGRAVFADTAGIRRYLCEGGVCTDARVEIG